jgi:hypothetical protein
LEPEPVVLSGVIWWLVVVVVDVPSTCTQPFVPSAHASA